MRGRSLLTAEHALNNSCPDLSIFSTNSSSCICWYLPFSMRKHQVEDSLLSFLSLFSLDNNLLGIWNVYLLQSSVAFHSDEVSSYRLLLNFLVRSSVNSVYGKKSFFTNSSILLEPIIFLGSHNCIGILSSIFLQESLLERIIASPKVFSGRLIAFSIVRVRV